MLAGQLVGGSLALSWDSTLLDYCVISNSCWWDWNELGRDHSTCMDEGTMDGRATAIARNWHTAGAGFSTWAACCSLRPLQGYLE